MQISLYKDKKSGHAAGNELTMSEIKNSKDTSIEILRIIACFFVICIHINLGYYFDEKLSRAALMLSCIRADAVAIFWMITGAFFFRACSYKKVVLRSISRILIPMVTLILFVLFFDGWMFQNMSIADSIRQAVSFHNIKAFIKCTFFQWVTPVGHTGQLWYLFSYLLVIVLFPVEKAFVDYLDSERKIVIFMIISGLLLMINDISFNQFACFSQHTFGAAIPAVNIMIWGHFVYLYREKIASKFHAGIWLLVFAVSNLFRWMILVRLYEKTENPPNFHLYWYTTFGLVSAVCIFMLVYSIDRKINDLNKIKAVLYFVGGNTFTIYLLHQIVIDLFNKYECIEQFRQYIEMDGTLIKQMIFFVCIGTMVFMASLLCSVVIMAIKKGIMHIKHVNAGLR